MSIPSFSEWPDIPQRSAPEADFDAKMYALFLHFATTHRNEMLVFISFLENNSTVIDGALNGTTIGLNTPAPGKFTALEAETLGGAAVQSSLTDATPGMVLLNGAHGLGSRDSSAIVVSDGHADLPTGFYAGGGGGAVNFPPNANYRPFLNLTRRIGPDDYRQVRIFFGAGNVPIVRYSDDKGVTWEEENALYGRRNLLGTVSQAAGVPTGAVIERGSNANGEYVRFADGLQICSAGVGSTSTAADETWTFPATYAVGHTPRCLILPGAGSGVARIGTWVTGDNTQVSYSIFDTSGARKSSYCHLTTIGRWF